MLSFAMRTIGGTGLDYRIIYINAQVIFAILFAVLYILERVNRRGQMPRKLDILYLMFMVSLVLDSIWIMIDGKPELRNWNLLLNLVYLSLMAAIGYVWFLYTLDMFPSKTKLRKYRYVLIIPVIIDLVLVITSPKTGWVFTVDENGYYVRASVHLFSFCINYIYMLLGTYAALVARKEAQLTSDKRRLGVAALFPAPILLLTTVQLLMPPGLPAFQGGVLISLLLVYATYQRVLVTRDSLTGLPNRYAFETDLVERINSYRPGTHLYLMEGDLNGFKKINDTLGHPMGDQVLRLTAEILTDLFSEYGSLVFRHGGDEFMVVVESNDPIDKDALREELNARLAKAGNPIFKDLSMSLGITEYTKDSDLKSMLSDVDVDLYRIKSQG